jgi:hypothetical protein
MTIPAFLPTITLTLYSSDVPTTWDTSGKLSSYRAISHSIMFVVAVRMASSSEELSPIVIRWVDDSTRGAGIDDPRNRST